MSNFKFPGQSDFYRGKVRDVYTIGNQWLVMIASDRISAFDVILPAPIPNKGQILNQIAAYMLDATRDICPNWLLDTPAPNVALGKLCKPLAVEIVVRGYLTGHAWRTYCSGRRSLCDVALPERMQENDPFPTPIITPSTKAREGHDEDISREQIIAGGSISEEDYAMIEKYALQLFERGSQIAASRGLILVDTKYEFGKIGNEICLMDEIHTPDSSRYFYSEGYDSRQQNKEKQKQLSKEFVREWLIENNFMGKERQVMPEMSGEWIATIRNRYIELFELLIGEKFVPVVLSDEECFEAINSELKLLEQPMT